MHLITEAAMRWTVCRLLVNYTYFCHVLQFPILIKEGWLDHCFFFIHQWDWDLYCSIFIIWILVIRTVNSHTQYLYFAVSFALQNSDYHFCSLNDIFFPWTTSFGHNKVKESLRSKIVLSYWSFHMCKCFECDIPYWVAPRSCKDYYLLTKYKGWDSLNKLISSVC